MSAAVVVVVAAVVVVVVFSIKVGGEMKKVTQYNGSGTPIRDANMCVR